MGKIRKHFILETDKGKAFVKCNGFSGLIPIAEKVFKDINGMIYPVSAITWHYERIKDRLGRK